MALQPRIVVASPHRYPDLARLWYRAVARDLLPALERVGLDVKVVLFRDAHVDEFDPSRFPGAILEAPRPAARDFLEFYDSVLSYESDYLFLLDADLFFVDPNWPGSWLPAFDDPDVAAVSFLRRSEHPGVYALLCRTAHYRALSRPVFAPTYEHLDDERKRVNRQPGDVAAKRLREQGRKILYADPAAAEDRIADFHGTTVIRASREVFGHLMSASGFDGLISRKRYFAMGAYDNALLGSLYQALFGEPFACGSDGESLAASVTAETFRQELERVENGELKAALEEYFDRSDRAIQLLAAREGVELELPSLRPASWRRR